MDFVGDFLYAGERNQVSRKNEFALKVRSGEVSPHIKNPRRRVPFRILQQPHFCNRRIEVFKIVKKVVFNPQVKLMEIEAPYIAKKAEPGRLTISDDIPEEVIPKGIEDLFNSAGVFEGIPVRHSRRFVYE